MFKKLFKLIKLLYNTGAVIDNNSVVEKEVCYHNTLYRVRTHRGHHCNKCGKRF